jgi:capsular exopolysaccharide synthesis family protein
MGAKPDLRTIYDDFDSQAPETAEFRRIFARLTRRRESGPNRLLLFSSAETGEGKTTSASLFSIVASHHQGLRTCLVDADLHRPRVHSLFGVAREAGFAEILAEELTIEAGLKPSRHERLKLLTAGSRHPFPSELLVPDRLASTFGKLKLLFDLIVVDAPPLLPVSDPAIVAREVDGVVMVVRAGKTQRDVALRAKEILQGVGANLLGVIVNNVDDVLPYYYGHNYYNYAYSSEAGEHSASSPEKSRRTKPSRRKVATSSGPRQ